MVERNSSQLRSMLIGQNTPLNSTTTPEFVVISLLPHLVILCACLFTYLCRDVQMVMMPQGAAACRGAQKEALAGVLYDKVRAYKHYASDV